MFPKGFDPSQLDPKIIAELSDLMRSLPPEQLMKLQTLMHNTMAGHSSQAELLALESTFPPGFREKMLGIMMRSGLNPASLASGISPAAQATPVSNASQNEPLPANEREARLTILRAVASGTIEVEDAYSVLFKD
jgi:hypothetical protein